MPVLAMNPLLKNQKIQDAHSAFVKKQTLSKKRYIQKRYEKFVNGINDEDTNIEKPLSTYQMRNLVEPKGFINHKANMYVSALNTGKILKVNPMKCEEYGISYDENLNKFVRK